MNIIKQIEELEFTITDIREELECHEKGIGCCLRQIDSCRDVLADFIDLANAEALCGRREARARASVKSGGLTDFEKCKGFYHHGEGYREVEKVGNNVFWRGNRTLVCTKNTSGWVLGGNVKYVAALYDRREARRIRREATTAVNYVDNCNQEIGE